MNKIRLVLLICTMITLSACTGSKATIKKITSDKTVSSPGPTPGSPASTPVIKKTNPPGSTPTPVVKEQEKEPKETIKPEILMKINDVGPNVKVVQKNLILLGYSLEADGIYGPITAGAINNFQKKNKMVVCDYVTKDLFNLISKEASKIKPTPEIKPAPKPSQKGISQKLYDYISIESHGKSVADKIHKDHGDFHNTCVLFVCEALRKSGFSISTSIWNTELLTKELERKGFKRNDNLKEMKPGAVAFTTDENGGKGLPTHSYIFLGWASDGAAWIFDNQVHDYGSHYHERMVTRHYLNNDLDKVKEATSYFMYK